MTTERTHLSIGEVLSLLQTDFPDITISKIRFLESQGLLDPERTPSGYRKFHDDDIEQLRWILTQQRDHFLPLKVIKERLAAGDLGGGTPEGVLPLGSERSASAAAEGSGTTTAGGAATTTETVERPVTPSETTDEATGSIASTAPSADRGEDDEEEPDRDAGASATPDQDVATPTDTAPTNGSTDEGHGRAEAVGRLVEAPPSEEEAEAPGPVEEEAEGEPTTPRGRRRHPTRHQPGDPTPDAAAGADAEPEAPVRTVGLEELTELSGLSAREVGELERYGLVAGETDGQTTTYDEECLVVARLAAGFARYGIEPRHLRMYKVAAEREAGLFEQLISPLLKQRRPAARQQAVEMLEDLAELADDLRAAMVRSALRDYLGGA